MPTAPPVPVPSVGISATDISGTWARISRGLPPGALDGCSYEVAFPKTIHQTAAGLTIVDGERESYHAEDAYIGPERLTGTYQDGVLRMSGFQHSNGVYTLPVSYELVYDPSTQHFDGTRNGEAIHLVPIYKPARCPTPPPHPCGPQP